MVAMEYGSPKRLPEDAYFITVPESVVLGMADCKEAVTAFCYLWSKKGRDSTVCFNVGRIVEWSGRRQNRNAGRINDRMRTAVMRMEDEGYVSIDGSIEGSSYAEATVNEDMVACLRRERSERFAMIYGDELRKVLDYGGLNPKDSFSSKDSLLLVFAYLRMVIYRRANKMSVIDDVGDKVRASPEVYNGYLRDMADEMMMTTKALSDAVCALEDIGLVYSEPLPRVKRDGEWRTGHTLFCNTDKREGLFLLAGGESYYRREIDNKKAQIASAAKRGR